MKKKSHKRKPWLNTGRQMVLVFVALVLLVATGVWCFLRFYNAYDDKLLYAERLNQMQEVTEQLFTGLEDVVNVQWDNARHQCNYLKAHDPATVDELLMVMQEQADLGELDKKQCNLIAIDTQGRYYYKDGKRGLLVDMSYLENRPAQVSYVYNDMTSDGSEMLFLYRLEDSVTVQDGESTVEIIYYGIAEDMEQLNPYFDCKAYNGNNSTYVVDGQGLKLFSGSSNSSGVLEGFNVFSVLRSMQYVHEASFDDTLHTMQEKGLAYSNAIMDGEEYYYALYQMENAEWILVFLVPSSYVATNTVQLVDTTTTLLLVFAVFMAVICALLIFVVLRIQQRKALQVAEKTNAMLEANNKKLELAQATTIDALQKAEDASKAKTDFLANMSHDIRTPMNAIVGITSLMEHEAGVTDKMENYIQKIQLSSHHLLGLINDILDMSRIESKEVHLNVEEVSLAEQIGQIDSMIRAQTNEHHQNFHIHVNEIAHEYLVGDGVRFRQVMLNLLSNAVKYTPSGGDITLDFQEVPCEKPGCAKFVCAVTDNGYGMTPEFLEHIFEPFTRAENSVTNKVQGTGLGMAITKNIVELMGGKIQVSSEIGKGSRFEVTLTMKINKQKESMLKGERILLVSSEPQLVKNMKASLSETAVGFFAVSTEEEAVSWLNKEGADIILLSGCLQNMTLKETIQVLRRCAKNATMIFCVDYIQDEGMQEKIAGSGVDGIVLRPFFLSNLEIAIARTKTLAVSGAENESILKGMRFLCAEDNELNAEILQEILSMYGATCTIYPNGKEIVDAFRDVRPGEYDAVLMDVQMPKMNGLEATRAIRNGSNPLGKTIPIIAMTANAFSEDVQHCIGAGMDAHIAKPLDIAVLEKTLRGLANGGQIARKYND